MLFKVLAVAGWAALAAVSTASAQSLAGPAEMPPAGYKGSQYVDSRGCVFLRAGIGGRTSWVPRVSRDRKALCGPSRATAAREVAAAEAAPAPRPEPKPPAPRVVNRPAQAVGRPMETIASQHRRTSVPRAIPTPQPQVAAAPAPRVQAGTAKLQNGCPASSPYGARVKMADGRTSLMCSSNADFDAQAAMQQVQVGRADTAKTQNTPEVTASNDGYTPKATGPSTGYRCPADTPIATRHQIRGGGSTVLCSTAPGDLAAAVAPVSVPKGYKKAWDDDRLNPKRGKGTARGQAQQDQVWTRDVPAELVANVPAAPRKAHVVSTSNAPRKAAGGRFYVQVGTFGEPANAQRSAARLKGMGLPVASSQIRSKGRSMQIVMAGPFGDAGSAQAALSKARRSGFGDAFIK